MGENYITDSKMLNAVFINVLSVFIFFYHVDSDKVTVYETESEHKHHDGVIRGIDQVVKNCIEDLFKDGVKKPKLIFRALQSRTMIVPTLAQLSNYLVYCRKNNLVLIISV